MRGTLTVTLTLADSGVCEFNMQIPERSRARKVKLVSYEKKINTIKEVRYLSGLGLKEAKAIVESTPTTFEVMSRITDLSLDGSITVMRHNGTDCHIVPSDTDGMPDMLAPVMEFIRERLK